MNGDKGILLEFSISPTISTSPFLHELKSEVDVVLIRKVHYIQHGSADAIVELFTKRFIHSEGFIQCGLFHAHHRDKHCTEAHGFGVVRNGSDPILKRIDIDSANRDAE